MRMSRDENFSCFISDNLHKLVNDKKLTRNPFALSNVTEEVPPTKIFQIIKLYFENVKKSNN